MKNLIGRTIGVLSSGIWSWSGFIMTLCLHRTSAGVTLGWTNADHRVSTDWRSQSAKARSPSGALPKAPRGGNPHRHAPEVGRACPNLQPRSRNQKIHHPASRMRKANIRPTSQATQSWHRLRLRFFIDVSDFGSVAMSTSTEAKANADLPSMILKLLCQQDHRQRLSISTWSPRPVLGRPLLRPFSALRCPIWLQCSRAGAGSLNRASQRTRGSAITLRGCDRHMSNREV